MNDYDRGFMSRCRDAGIPHGAASAMLKAAAYSHSVSRGETVDSIARKYGIPSSVLMSGNGISDPSRLRAGQVLSVPSRLDVAKMDLPPDVPLTKKVPARTNGNVVLPPSGEYGLVDWGSYISDTPFVLNEEGTNAVHSAYSEPAEMATAARKRSAGVPVNVPYAVSKDGKLFPVAYNDSGDPQIDYDEIAREWIEARDRESYENRRNEAIENVEDFTRKWEKFRPKAYWDSKGKKWTLGYGQTRINGRPVAKGDTTTRDAALRWLRDTMRGNYDYAWSNTPRFHELDLDPLSVISDLMYNGGMGAVKPGHEMYRQLADPVKYPDPNRVVYDNIGNYNKANGEFVQGLQNRRDAIKKEFLSGYAPVVR